MKVSATVDGIPMEVLVDPWHVDITVETFLEMGAIAVSVKEEK